MKINNFDFEKLLLFYQEHPVIKDFLKEFSSIDTYFNIQNLIRMDNSLDITIYYTSIVFKDKNNGIFLEIPKEDLFLKTVIKILEDPASISLLNFV